MRMIRAMVTAVIVVAMTAGIASAKDKHLPGDGLTLETRDANVFTLRAGADGTAPDGGAVVAIMAGESVLDGARGVIVYLRNPLRIGFGYQFLIDPPQIVLPMVLDAVRGVAAEPLTCGRVDVDHHPIDYWRCR